MKCPQCGQRPSRAIQVVVYDPDGRLIDCPDPIHDLADEAPTLKARVEELEEGLTLSVNEERRLRSKWQTVFAERDAARASLEEAVGLVRELVKRTPFVLSPGGIVLTLPMEQLKRHQAFLARHPAPAKGASDGV